MPELSKCSADFGLFCLTTAELLLPLFLLTLLGGAGWLSSRRDLQAFKSNIRFGLRAAAAFTSVGLAATAWFVAFEPGAVQSSSSEPAKQAAWIVSASLLAAGISLFFGVAAYAAGGFIGGARRKSDPRPFLIAVDGPAASGKGTLAKRIANHFGFAWLDTGLIYRAVARDVLAAGRSLDDAAAAVAAAKALDASTFTDHDLRGPRAGDAASIVAKIPEVREALLEYQRTFARRGPGAVLDGRDIGTVVCPDAHVKIFVTASDEARARRRFLEHQARGDSIEYAELLADIRARDARDKERATAPLKAAVDAVTLDTTSLDADQAFAAALKIIERIRKC